MKVWGEDAWVRVCGDTWLSLRGGAGVYVCMCVHSAY